MLSGAINSLLWILILIVIIAAVIAVVRAVVTPRDATVVEEQPVVREQPVLREQPVVRQAPPAASGLTPGWYPDQNDPSLTVEFGPHRLNRTRNHFAPSLRACRDARHPSGTLCSSGASRVAVGTRPGRARHVLWWSDRCLPDSRRWQ